jgi:signal transduction histidine kinase
MPERRRWPAARQVLLGVLLAQLLAVPAVGWGVLRPLVHRSAHELATAMQLAAAQWRALAADPPARRVWGEALARDHGLQILEDAPAAAIPPGLDVYVWALTHALPSGSVSVIQGPQGSLVQWVDDPAPGPALRVVATPPRLRPAVLALLALQLSGIAGTLLALRWQTRLALQQRRKTILLGSLAHDLRTPLTRLRLLVDLQDGLPGADRAAMLGSVAALQLLVDQSLDLFTPSGDGALPTQGWAEWVAARQAAWPDVAWTGVDTPAADARLPHPETLARALGNLLDNARHHGRAPVRVTVRDEGQALHLTVEDAGAGVSAAVWKSLCRQEVPKAQGHGIGLLSTRWRMERAGGALTWHRGVLGLRMPWAGMP